MATSEERQHILNMIAEQQITVDQGTQLLTALTDSDDLTVYEDDTELYPLDMVSPQDLWLTPLWIGAMLSMSGGSDLCASLSKQPGSCLAVDCMRLARVRTRPADDGRGLACTRRAVGVRAYHVCLPA